MARGELPAIGMPDHDGRPAVLGAGVDAVGERGRPRHPRVRCDVQGAAAQGQRPSQQDPIEGVDQGGEVAPAIFPTSDAGHLGLPEKVGRGHIERLALHLRVRLAPSPQEPPRVQQPSGPLPVQHVAGRPGTGGDLAIPRRQKPAPKVWIAVATSQCAGPKSLDCQASGSPGATGCGRRGRRPAVRSATSSSASPPAGDIAAGGRRPIGGHLRHPCSARNRDPVLDHELVGGGGDASVHVNRGETFASRPISNASYPIVHSATASCLDNTTSREFLLSLSAKVASMPSSPCSRHRTNVLSEIPSSPHVTDTVSRLLITPTTASRFCAAAKVDFRPVRISSTSDHAACNPLPKGLSTHIKGSLRVPNG